ncbi:MAG: ATP synthase F1 subunit gamma [Clostridiales bacterium]|nr:ATP synthase F1 subunit gamma [Clostridiales bacterium]
MAGKGMRDIKRRIKSVNSTKQITKAMELVSSAKLRKAREKLDRTRPYFYTVKNTMSEIAENIENIHSDYFEGAREIKKSCFIVITADGGLCGGYNTNVMKEALLHMRGKEEVSVIAIGQKGRDFFKKRGYKINGEYINVIEKITFKDAKSISSLVIKLYKDREFDEVYLVYTDFVSTITQKPEVIRLLPLSGFNKTEEKGSETVQNNNFEMISYEPSPEDLFNYLVPSYVESLIFGGLVSSSASEQGARRIAMENATDNAVEMIDKLTLNYNRARQAAITQEISEIVGGAEALK